jgi:voltage-dependent anion channel protein 2
LDISKDVLSADYSLKNQVKISSVADNGTTLAGTSTKKGDGILHDVKVSFKPSDVLAVEAKVDTSGKLSFKVDYTEIQNVKVTANTSLPDVTAGDLELNYAAGGSSFATSATLSAAPKFLVSASNSSYVKGLTAAVEMSFDAASGAWTKYGVAAMFKQGDLTGTAVATDKFDTVKVGMAHQYSDAFAWAAEYVKKLSRGDGSFTIGTSYKMDNSSSIKTKLDNNGILTTCYKLEVKKGTSFAATAEMSALNLERAPKLGFTCVLK